jgi:hypothetical protein
VFDAKAVIPIEVTEFEIVTEVILDCSSAVFEILLKALAAIDVTPSGITTAPAQSRVLEMTTLLRIANEPPALHATLIGGLSLDATGVPYIVGVRPFPEVSACAVGSVVSYRVFNRSVVPEVIALIPAYPADCVAASGAAGEEKLDV